MTTTSVPTCGTITLQSGALHVLGSDMAELSSDCCQCSMEAVQLHVVGLRQEHTTAMHQLQMDASSLSLALAQHMDEARAENEEHSQRSRCVTHACDMAR